jgi:hypothetical protein
MTEAALVEQLFPPKKANREGTEPGWLQIDIELKQ